MITYEGKFFKPIVPKIVTTNGAVQRAKKTRKRLSALFKMQSYRLSKNNGGSNKTPLNYF